MNSIIARGRYVDVHFGHQRIYAMNKRRRTIEIYRINELRCPETLETRNRFLFDRLTDNFIGVKDAWVTFAASEQPLIGRYVARDAVKLYMSPWHAATSLMKRRMTRWAGCGRLEAPTPAAAAW